MPLTLGSSIPSVVVRERVYIPRELVHSIEKIKTDLFIRNSALDAAEARGFGARKNAPEYFALYEETEMHIIVPRAYEWRATLKGKDGRDYRVVDLCASRGRLGSCDLVQLGPNHWQRFDQHPGFSKLSSADRSPHGRMFVLRCGGGKTPIALKAAHARGGRTLWVTITDALVDQVKGRRYGQGKKARVVEGDITRYLGIPFDQIGHVQADKQRWRGFGIAVATLQTLARSTSLPDEFWEYWDLVIFDEGDVLGAPEFHKVVPRFRAERWVLTATPKRNDGLEELFMLHTGPICYEHTEFDLVPDCYFVPTKAPASLAVHRGWDWKREEPRFSFALSAKNLLLDEERQDLVISHVCKALDKDRTVLVTGDSIEGMALLKKRAEDEWGVDCGLVTSETKRTQRMDAIQVPPVVFATTGIFQRGLDRVRFDTLIPASIVTVNPVLMNQLPGRILRWDPDNPDKRPIITLLVDVHIEELRLMAAKAAELFRSRKWPIYGIADQLIAERRARRRKW